ncbi:hypothetical protein NC652_013519 [Populus alba x Populus x berolinensis]|uniref:RING-type domain-containing protein n=1 Tax=Populus alba x Populus x berolinensis TaxID=444605 RepID=A0AAD6QUV0_9ROSI|nr:hypothetical protein NC652_013519 [Populus alba x Populus x berolinensis]KAJ6996896.1 hypothetical protein NC653_013474 [Populus alba x Populus x berolinensis]
MPRFTRILNTKAAEPPAAVNLESDFVVILAALLCALICVVGLIAAARCAWLRRVTGAASRGPPPQAKANKGVKKKNLQLLPRFTYSAGGGGAAATSFGTTECAICLGEFVEGDEVRVLPQCGHGFHVGCIDRWLGSHSSCPSCRQILVVARCQKCGQFPASTSSSSCGGGNATEILSMAGFRIRFWALSSVSRLMRHRFDSTVIIGLNIR